jgi:hypothetical protein
MAWQVTSGERLVLKPAKINIWCPLFPFEPGIVKKERIDYEKQALRTSTLLTY